MKTLATLATISSFLLAACSSTYQTSMPYDDVYNTSREKPVAVNPAPAPAPAPTYTSPEQSNQGNYDNQQVAPNANSDTQDQNSPGTRQGEEPAYSKSETFNSPDGNTYVNNNYYYGYNSDDYYDYGYSARIRRFDYPWYYHGYYDDYFTNSYWYNYDPMCYGSSIYFGYNWLGPHFGLSLGWDPFWYRPYYGMYGGFGWGYPWYDPWCGWGGFGSYYNGYYNGYWGGYYSGIYDPYGYYYNSHDINTHHYGPRQPRSSSNGHSIGGKSAGINSNRMSFGEKYQQAIASANTSRSVKESSSPNPAVSIVKPNNAPGTVRNNTEPVKTPGQSIQPNGIRQQNPTADKISKSQNNRNTGQIQKPNIQKYRNQGRQLDARQQTGTSKLNNNKPRYNNPTQTQRYSKPKNYYSPNYTKPKSSQEYVSPKTENGSSQQIIRERPNPSQSRSSQGERYYYSPEQRSSGGGERMAPSRTESPRGSAPAVNNSGSDRGSGGGGSRSSGSSGSGSGSSGRRR